ncbi:MAG: hypothetical protein N838_01480 [Thiohalocapsa sp. PB-PSB1]|jgi:hypothetical protein|nr:MAG: hypothetical protein N838_01480 [Thiohalocapsa sp. PB-PSB1]
MSFPHDGDRQLVRQRYIVKPDRLRPRQQRRSEPRLADGCATHGRLREDLYRQHDRVAVGPAWVGADDGLCPPRRYAGGHGAQPHDALVLETAKVLQQRGVELVSLRESIDTTTAMGRCFLSMT